jgi:hypothetical protein
VGEPELIENRVGSTIDHFMDLIESKTIQEREGTCFHWLRFTAQPG